jgi:hypothetical protein
LLNLQQRFSLGLWPGTGCSFGLTCRGTLDFPWVFWDSGLLRGSWLDLYLFLLYCLLLLGLFYFLGTDLSQFCLALPGLDYFLGRLLLDLRLFDFCSLSRGRRELFQYN